MFSLFLQNVKNNRNLNIPGPAAMHVWVLAFLVQPEKILIQPPPIRFFGRQMYNTRYKRLHPHVNRKTMSYQQKNSVMVLVKPSKF